MARRGRYAPGGKIFHVTNRGNDRRVIFRQDQDYKRFLRTLRVGTRRHPVKIYGFCAMPNHFHLIVEPKTDDALSAYMQWVTCCYACDLRARTETKGHGHVFQRRFWSAPINHDLDFLITLRYVEANALRAGLVPRAEDWRWGSLGDRRENVRKLLSPLPMTLPAGWCELVNLVQREEVLDRIRRSLNPQPGRQSGS